MRLKELRRLANKTQEEVANDLHLKKQTYQNYELLKREPDIQTLKQMANYFNVSTDYLLDYKDNYNLPALSTEQIELMKVIIQLNAVNLAKATSYSLGLLAAQE